MAEREPATGEPAQGERHGLLESLGERVISVRSMDRRVQVVTAVVALQGLVVAAMIVFGGSLGSPLDISVVDGRLVTMPAPVFIACTAFLVLAWTYMLAGAHHGHVLLRLAAAALFTYSTTDLWQLAAAADSPAHALVIACVAGVWLVGGAVLVVDLRHGRRGHDDRRHRHHLKPLTFAITALLVGGAFGFTYLADARVGTPLLFREAVYNHFQLLTNFLIPMLVLTAADFSEIGVVGSEWVASKAARLGSPTPLALLAALAGGGVLAISLWGGVAWPAVFEMLGYAAILAVVVGWFVARGRSRLQGTTRIPYAAIAAAAVAAFGVQFVTLNLLVPGLLPQQKGALGTTLTDYQHAAQPVFSLRYPATWHLTPHEPDASGTALYDFLGFQSGSAAVFEALTVKAPPGTDPDQLGAALAQGFNATPSGPWSAAGAWRHLDYTRGSKIRGEIWARIEGDRFWALNAFATTKSWSASAPVFAQMTESFTFKAGTAAPLESNADLVAATVRHVSAGEGLLWLLVGLSAGGLLAFRRRLPGSLPGGLVFTSVFGLLLFGLDLRSLAETIAERTGAHLGSYPHGIGTWGWKVSAAAFGLLFVGAWLTAGRRDRRWVPGLRAVLVLVVALQLVSWMYDGYTAEMSASGKFSLVAALVVILALAWDVVMSGESITNRHGIWFPRHTRVTIYLGYEMLVSSAVLFFSSLHVQATGKALAAQFESDAWPQFGLLEIGVPFVVTLFAIQFGACAAGLGREPAAAAASPASEVRPEPLPV